MWVVTQMVIRNVAISVVLTKFLTQPLVKIFEKPEQFEPEDMIGRECVISTYEATTEFGQAKFKTDAAPLLLNVKTEDGRMAKGDRAVIVDYDDNTKVYFVTPSETKKVEAE